MTRLPIELSWTAKNTTTNNHNNLRTPKTKPSSSVLFRSQYARIYWFHLIIAPSCVRGPSNYPRIIIPSDNLLNMNGPKDNNKPAGKRLFTITRVLIVILRNLFTGNPTVCLLLSEANKQGSRTNFQEVGRK